MQVVCSRLASCQAEKKILTAGGAEYDDISLG